MVFRPRELREGTSLDELRRELNEAQKQLAAELTALSTRAKVSPLILDGPYAAQYGEVVRVAPPSGGLRVILPPRNLAQPGARVVIVQEAATGALTVEAVDTTVNGSTTLAYQAGVGTVELQLTDGGWYGWSASLILNVPLTALAPQASDTFVGNVSGASAVPVAVGLGTLAGAGLAFASHTLDVTGSTSITITSDQVQRAALTGEVTASANSNATTLADGVVDPANLFVDNNFGVPFLLRTVFAAAAAGTADDVTIYSGNAPFAFRIVDAWVEVATAIGGSTVQLRTASGGGGSALSTALSTAGTGTARNNDTASRSVTAAGSVFLRRSDRGVAGTILILALRE